MWLARDLLPFALDRGYVQMDISPFKARDKSEEIATWLMFIGRLLAMNTTLLPMR
jgi:hypothetical protein